MLVSAPASARAAQQVFINGVNSVQLIKAGVSEDRFGVTLKLSNASKPPLYDFMAFSPAEVVAATEASAVALGNLRGRWIEPLLPGTSMTLQTGTDSRGAATR